MSEDVQVKLRIPPEVKEHIEKKAEESYRSINSEVLYRLEQFKKIENISFNSLAHEFSQILASTLVQDPKVDIHREVHGFRQPSINGVRQAFELFVFRDLTNRKDFGIRESDEELCFFNRNREYIIKKNNLFPDGAYTINHLTRILEKLYFRPMLGLDNED